MKTLLLLRHAKSSWAEPGRSDHDRPLNDRGKRDAPRMGRLLAREGWIPDCIVTSTARRARKTAAKLAKAAGCSGPIVETDALYLAGPEAYASVLRELPEDVNRVLLVGHNPGMEEFFARLTGSDRNLTTAALARIELNLDRWSAFDLNTPARLGDFRTPKDPDLD